MSEFTTSASFTDTERAQVARLYWQAFAAKLGKILEKILGPDAPALGFFAQIISPDFALVARRPDSTVIGVAGFRTAKGALPNGGMRDIAQHYGWFGDLWKGPLLAMLERDLADGILLMDGICVDASARGLGVGTALLHAIKAEARAQGLRHVRLDVIDTNPRAQALSLREGFVAGQVEHLGPLRWLFGFLSATRMTWAA